MKNLYKAISNVQSEAKILKEASNPFFKSKYAELSAIMEVLRPILTKHGLVVIQPVNGNSVKTIVCHTESGETIESEYPLNPNPDPQKFLASVTYARRGSLSILGIVAEDDDDGNTASGHTSTVITKPEAPKQENKNGYVPPVKKEWKDLTPAEQFAWFVKKAEKEGIKIDLDAMSTLPVSDRISIIKKALNDKKKAETVNEPF